MIASYVFHIDTNDPLPAGRAYSFYSCLLSMLSEDYAEALHAQGETPISQFLYREGSETFWRVNLLDQYAADAVCPILDGLKTLPLHSGEIGIEQTERRTATAETLIQDAARNGATRFFKLLFRSPTAFKQAGRYVILPDKELILQSLVNKWNTAFPSYPLGDADALRMLTEGIRVSDYRLRTTRFSIKENKIPGFIGELTLDAQLAAPIMELWTLLLAFSEYSGVGIKTALGMGGVTLS